MDFTILGQVLGELQLPVDYLEKFKGECMDDKIFQLVYKDDELKEELRSIVPVTGHRISILNAFKMAINVNKVKCSHCDLQLELKWIVIWSHLQRAHQVNTRCKSFTCPVCDSEFIWFNSFQRHFNQHKIKNENNVPLSIPQLNEPPEESSENYYSKTEEVKQTNWEDLMSDFEKRVVCFVVKLLSTGRLPASLCIEICSMTRSLLEQAIIICDAAFKEGKFGEKTILISRFEDAFKHVRSQYCIEKYLKTTGCYVQPEEISLGSRHKVSSRKGITTTKMVHDTCQYVPISSTLKNVLELPGVMESVISQLRQSNCEDLVPIHSNPMHSSYFKEQNRPTNFDVKSPVLFLLLFFDELEITNVLSSRAGIHKLGNCYFSILNIDMYFNSKLENIFHCLTFKSKDMVKYSIRKVMKPIINEISKLEATGLCIDSEAFKGRISIRLGQVIGDNLGIHMLFGYVQSFSANYYCRFCKMSKFQCQSAGRYFQQFGRNRANYCQDLQRNAPSETGIKTTSPFNDLRFFHVTENYSPDIMHDIFEGIAPLDLKLVFLHMFQLGISIEALNFRLASFNYQSYNSSKPSPLQMNKLTGNDTKMGQTAGQIIAMLFCFPFLFGDLLDPNDPYYNLVLLLVDITRIIMAPSISNPMLDVLRDLIEDHHYLYQMLSKCNLRPKHHFVTHYPELIKQIGPLQRYWTMRNEGRHKFFKAVASICGNFKNICKTVTGRNQLYASYRFLLKEPFNSSVCELGGILCSSEETKYGDHLSQYFGEDNFTILLLDKIEISAMLLSASNSVVIENTAEGPTFGTLEIIFKYRSKIYFVVSKLLTDYASHVRAYQIRGTEQVLVVPLADVFLSRVNVFQDFKTSFKWGNLEKPLIGPVTVETQGDLTTVFIPNENVTGEIPTTNIQCSNSSQGPKRNRKRKLFFDEEDEIMNVKEVLLQHDKELRVNFGAEIIKTAESMKPLPPKLRRHLVKILCQDLVKRTHSAMPSTDQRDQLANCIVAQLYPTFSGVQFKELKESYYFPSTTITDSITGKKRSISPTGHIQYHFKNFWSSIRQPSGVMNLKSTEDPIAENGFENVNPHSDVLDMKSWLMNHAAPNQKVFDYLLKTFTLRRSELLRCKHDCDYSTFFEEWPRILDTPGAIEHDFNQTYPLVADNLSSKWEVCSEKIIIYFGSMKKSLAAFGIPTIPDEGRSTAAFFMLGVLLRSKVKRMTQADSVKSFVRVINPMEDVDAIAAALDKTTTVIICKGSLDTLSFQSFFVAFNSVAIKVETFLSAVDLAFKTFYVFNIPFPASCGAVWQFLDYYIYDMVQKVPLPPGVSELAAFLNQG